MTPKRKYVERSDNNTAQSSQSRYARLDEGSGPKRTQPQANPVHTRSTPRFQYKQFIEPVGNNSKTMTPKREYVKRSDNNTAQSPQSQYARLDEGSGPRRTQPQANPVPTSSLQVLQYRPFIEPVGNNSFKPRDIIFRIVPQCVTPFYQPDWLTVRTCDLKARSVWFKRFRELFTWDPAHDTWVRNNFNNKVEQLLMNRRTYARKNDLKLKKIQEANKSKTRVEELRREFSRHRIDDIPTQATREKRSIKLGRESTTHEMHKRFKIMEDGSNLDPNGQNIVEPLENSEHMHHESDSDETQYLEPEDIETYAREIGLTRQERSPPPRHIGTAATAVEGTKFHRSQQSTYSGPNITSSTQPNLNMTQLQDELEKIFAVQDQKMQRMIELFTRVMASKSTDLPALPPPQ